MTQPGQQPPQFPYNPQPNQNQLPPQSPQFPYNPPPQNKQPPTNWNPAGVYGGVPAPKRNFSWIFFIFIGLIVLVVILKLATGTITVTEKSTPKNQTNNLVVTEPTTAKTGQVSTTGKGIGKLVTGPGQELVGQGGVYNDLKLEVTSTERYSEIYDDGKVITSQGVFLVVLYDLENVGTEPHGVIFMKLVDGKGRKFSTTSNADARFVFIFSDAYPKDDMLQPTFKGKSYQVFELPTDASNLKIDFGL